MTSRKFPEQSQSRTDQIREQLLAIERADAIYGCHTITTPGTYQGWLYNLYETVFFRDPSESKESSIEGVILYAAVECYFMTTALDLFKITVPVKPYFYIQAPVENYSFIQECLLLQYPNLSIDMDLVERNDLSIHNHISSEGAVHLRLTFNNLTELRTVSTTLIGLLRQKELSAAGDIYNKAVTTRITPYTNVKSIPQTLSSLANYISNILEHDVNLSARFLIDNKLTMSTWYSVTVRPEFEFPLLEKLEGGDFELPPVPRVLAYDIETTKKPLRFPNAEAGDQIMCISYMLDDQGYLLINRSIFSRDITDFEYTPKPEYPGKFACFNLPTEKDLLVFFFTHIRTARPNIFATFNGDFFDWPFVDVRAASYGMSLLDQIGVLKSESTSRAGLVEKQYYARAVPHLDCFRWVRRDSYLPQGSQGLKAVTRAKLKYHPDELSPELMVSYAQTDPQVLASYSVSDAVATYYLYRKYVHPFIFVLGTILPLNPDDILRRGTGTLCEHLLMVEAYYANVPFPNKHNDPLLQVVLDAHKEKRILLSQTYVGGKVEAINAGVYRNDIVYDFTYYSEAFKSKRFEGYGYLLRHIDRDLVIQLSVSKVCNEHVPAYQKVLHLIEEIKIDQKALEYICEKKLQSSIPTELYFCKTPNKNIIWLPDNWIKTRDLSKDIFMKHLESYSSHVDALITFLETNICSNYSKVRTDIINRLITCSNTISSKPLLYHLDVAAMYPNIMLTNKLQPIAIVDPNTTCASCDFSTIKEAQVCQRIMEWDWRGSYYPLDFSEYLMIKNQTITQIGADRWTHTLSESEKAKLLHERLEMYSKSQYKVKQKTEELRRKTIVCQRENSFFIDTVRKFRDRRYRFKNEQKEHSSKLNKAKKQLSMLIDAGLDASPEAQGLRKEIDSQTGLIVLKESLQLAHKCILNSFYGYAMRKGSRWYSLEMAAAVTHTGANIIKRARALIEMIGFVLELDTDGVWCCLPSSFPETCTFLINNLSDIDNQSIQKVSFSYPGTILNALTQTQNTNKQYLINVIHTKRTSPYDKNNTELEHSTFVQKGFSGFDSNDMSSLLYASPISNSSLINKDVLSSNNQSEPLTKAWKRINECTIEFEVDGPYSCMVLSAAREEGVRIKKKYAVFDLAGNLSELKGFELKRRGELKIIKSFQTRVFAQFLKGDSLEDAYKYAAQIANTYLDIIYTRGAFLTDQQLITLISEASTLKNSLNSTPKNRKSTSITCARRMTSFLDPLFASVDGLSVEYIISKLPEGTPVSERAIPVQIFSSPENVQSKFLRQWIGEQNSDGFSNIRDLIDWNYYLTRLSGAIYKIIVVPSGLQGITSSPVHRIAFPDWLAQSQTQSQSNQFKTMLQKYLNMGNKRSSNIKSSPPLAVNKEDSCSFDDEQVSFTNEIDSQEEFSDESKEHDDGSDDDGDAINDDHEEVNNKSSSVSHSSNSQIITYPKTVAEFLNWYTHQTTYWKELLSKNIIGKPCYLSCGGSIGGKNSITHQLQTRLSVNKAAYATINDFQLYILTINVLPSGKVSCYCITKNNTMKKVIFGTSVRVYFNIKTAIPQSVIDDHTSPTLTISDVTNKGLVLPDMACCTQLLLYEMSADTYVSGRSSFQELANSVVVTDVYESDVSGPFRFLIELPRRLDLPETYESRQYLNMGEIPYIYLANHGTQGQIRSSTDYFSIFPFSETTKRPSHHFGFITETDDYILALSPAGQLIFITFNSDYRLLKSDRSKSMEELVSSLALLFIQVLEDSVSEIPKDTKNLDKLTLDSLIFYTFNYILRDINQYRFTKHEGPSKVNTHAFKNIIFVDETTNLQDALSILEAYFREGCYTALLFWRTVHIDGKQSKSSLHNIYFREQHFIIDLPMNPCQFRDIIIPKNQDSNQNQSQKTVSVEPNLKQLPELSSSMQTMKNKEHVIAAIQSLVDLIIDSLVAQYVSHIFTIPINLLLDEVEFCKVVLPQYLLHVTHPPGTTINLFLDTLIAREYANNNMLLPSRDREELTIPTIEYTLQSGMYHGYSLMMSVRNTIVQLLMNYLMKPPIVVTDSCSQSQATRALPAHVTSTTRLRMLGKTIKNLIFSPIIPGHFKHHISSMLKTYLYSSRSLLFSNGMVEVLHEELRQFYTAYSNILAESGYTLVYADTIKNIIASEKLDPELLLNSYRHLLRNIYSSSIFQLYELPSVDAVYHCLCTCPYTSDIKNSLAMQLYNDTIISTDKSILLSKTKLRKASDSSPNSNLRLLTTPHQPTICEETATMEMDLSFNTNTPNITIMRHLAFIDIENYFGYSRNLDSVIGHFSAKEPLPKDLKYVFQVAVSAYSLIMIDNVSKSAKSVSSANMELKNNGKRFIEFLQRCAFDMMPLTKDDHDIIVDKLTTLQANVKTCNALRTLSNLFHVYYIKNITEWPQDVTQMCAQAGMSAILNTLSPGIYFLTIFLHIFSLDERIKDAAGSFCWGILPGLGVYSPLDTRLKYTELFQEYNIPNVLCTTCGQLNCIDVMRVKVFHCYSCGQIIENSMLEKSLIKRLSQLVSDYFTRKGAPRILIIHKHNSLNESNEENLLNGLKDELKILLLTAQIHSMFNVSEMCTWWGQQLKHQNK